LSAMAYLERRVTRKKIKEMMEKVATKIGNEEDQDDGIYLQQALTREQNIEIYNKVMSNWRGF